MIATYAVRQERLASPEVLEVECIDSLWGLAALRPEWNGLLRASAANGPFLTWEWLHAWWTHLGGSGSLNILTARAGHELVALAPLRLVPHALPWFSHLEFLGTGYAGSDYLDLIVRSGHEEDAICAVSRFLEMQRLAFRLDHLGEDSLSARLAERLGSAGWATLTIPDGICPVIPLSGHSWDSYLATLGSAHRANVRRRLRGIEQQFRVSFELVTSQTARKEALDALAGFHRRRFEAIGGSTAFLTPEVCAFQEEATQRALDRGWLRMYVLRLDQDVAAVMYGFFYNGTFYFYQHGFDDRYARHSAGLVLMAFTIRAAIDEGAHTFDLLWGAEGYKSLWTRESSALHRIHLFPPHPAGRMHRHAVDGRQRLARLLHHVLPSGRAS